jgi:hypothetical protein
MFITETHRSSFGLTSGFFRKYKGDSIIYISLQMLPPNLFNNTAKRTTKEMYFLNQDG